MELRINRVRINRARPVMLTLYSHTVQALFVSYDVGKYEIRCQLVKGVTFQGCRLYWSLLILNDTAKTIVGNIGILVLWRDREKLFMRRRLCLIDPVICHN